MSIILGIDPGVARVGYGLVKRHDDDSASFLDCGILETSPGDHLANRLLIIYKDLCDLLAEYEPSEFAIEQIFFGRNISTAFAIGHASGVIQLAAAQHKLRVHTYTPPEIKRALTGTGKADKSQIQAMVTLQLQLSATPKPDDAADALAIALCHLHQFRYANLMRNLEGGGNTPN